MKLYKFTLSTWRSTEVSRTVLEVEEKTKNYIERRAYSSVRISKSDIGVVSGYYDSTLYLLEDDMEKAKAIFAESLKGKIENEKSKLGCAIKQCNERILEYKKGIAELLKGEEG